MKSPNSRQLLAIGLSALAATLMAGCNQTPEPAAPAAAVTMGTQLDDSVITASVKSALLADPAIKSFDLQVETRKGTVLLSGFVDSQAQIDQAQAIARGVSGVSQVENSVTVKGTPSTAGNVVDDATVTGRVKAALLADARIKSFDIGVVTYKGQVQLSGFVDNQGQIDQAARIASAAEGATSIKNELRIKQ